MTTSTTVWQQQGFAVLSLVGIPSQPMVHSFHTDEIEASIAKTDARRQLRPEFLVGLRVVHAQLTFELPSDPIELHRNV